ncbi:hypothetical protein MTO96_037683, partial [Rhipicephalus appendiculatus]
KEKIAARPPSFSTGQAEPR